MLVLGGSRFGGQGEGGHARLAVQQRLLGGVRVGQAQLRRQPRPVSRAVVSVQGELLADVIYRNCDTVSEYIGKQMKNKHLATLYNIFEFLNTNGSFVTL